MSSPKIVVSAIFDRQKIIVRRLNNSRRAKDILDTWSSINYCSLNSRAFQGVYHIWVAYEKIRHVVPYSTQIAMTRTYRCTKKKTIRYSRSETFRSLLFPSQCAHSSTLKMEAKFSLEMSGYICSTRRYNAE